MSFYIQRRKCVKCGGVFFRESNGVCIPCLDRVADEVEARLRAHGEDMNDRNKYSMGYSELKRYVISPEEKRVVYAAQNARSLLEAAEIAGVGCTGMKTTIARIRKRKPRD